MYLHIHACMHHSVLDCQHQPVLKELGTGSADIANASQVSMPLDY